MTRRILFIFILLASVLSGCSKDKEVEQFIADLDSFSDELVKKAEKDGIDAAQKHFDEKSPALKATYKEVAEYRGFQVSEDTMKKFEDSVLKNTMAVAELQLKFIANPKEGKKAEKLAKDYQEMLTDV